jgi:O-antigen ligase
MQKAIPNKDHQELLVTPGIFPLSASVLKQIRHMLKSRRKPRERPQRGQRFFSLTANFAFLLDFAIFDFLAMITPYIVKVV